MSTLTRRKLFRYGAGTGASMLAPGFATPVLGAKTGVKVTKVEVLRASTYAYVKVHTDAGVHGVGELHPASTSSGPEEMFATPIAAVKYCETYLIGKDPTHIERHWQHMFRRTLFRGGADPMAAIGAIDMALWDIAGKLAGLPVHKLLGGPTREKVRAFTHIGGSTPEQLADQARQRVEQGFTIVRFLPVTGRAAFEDNSYARMVGSAERCVSAVRKAVGAEIDIALEMVCLLKPQEAIGVGRVLAPYDIMFFEDPIEPDNIDALAHVAANLPMPVATGERLYTIHQFRELLNKNAAAFLRPDPALAGGITNIKKIAALGEANYVDVMPHNPCSCVLTAANVQLDAAIHNIAAQEYGLGEFQKPKRDLVKEPLKFDRGYVVVPDGPGLGIELNEEAFKHYPPVAYKRAPKISLDGGLRDY